MGVIEGTSRAWRSPWTRWILLAAVIFLALLNLFDLRLVGSDPNPEAFGTVSDWFTGLMTLGAVSLAALALRDDRRKLAVEAEERRAAIEEARVATEETESAQRRVEAGRVFAWLEPSTDVLGRTASAVDLVLTNDTVAPIYVWMASLAGTGRSLADQKGYGPLLPGVRRVRLEDQPLLAEVNRVDSPAPSLELRFTAGNGETLMRDGSGNLDRLA